MIELHHRQKEGVLGEVVVECVPDFPLQDRLIIHLAGNEQSEE